MLDILAYTLNSNLLIDYENVYLLRFNYSEPPIWIFNLPIPKAY